MSVTSLDLAPKSLPKVPAGKGVGGRGLADPVLVRERLLSTASPRRHRAPTPGRIARRRFIVLWSKRLLPLVALGLLASIALWPELNRASEQGRVAFRRLTGIDQDAGRLAEPRYRGVDVRGRPYTLTADIAQQAGPERVNLTKPIGDVTTQGGTWLQVSSREGVFMQHTNQLDLSGDVVLYRDDGTTVRSETTAVDLKQGAATSNDMTHAEGPFGTLDSHGYTLTDKGDVLQFRGPARLVLNSHDHPALAQPGAQPSAQASPPTQPVQAAEAQPPQPARPRAGAQGGS